VIAVETNAMKKLFQAAVANVGSERNRAKFASPTKVPSALFRLWESSA
jgi:hypothetical protein